MLNQKDFFIRYNISQKAYSSTKLKWDDLLKIYEDYADYRESLEPSATFIFNTLMKSPKVHSVRYRLKSPEHLIEKIIRKKIDDPQINITLFNYKQEIHDLIGLRALHLFKDDWLPVHEYINSVWTLKGPATANYRKGDDDQIIKIFKENGCLVKEHKYGYRSIHYIIETKPAKETIYAEIQVRTIYEEAWAEIDHTIRYPYELDNEIFFQFLLILNRLSGSADEMGTFIKFLKNELDSKEELFRKQLNEKEKLIKDLEEKLGSLHVPSSYIAKIKDGILKIANTELYNPNLEGKIEVFKTTFGKQVNQSIYRRYLNLSNHTNLPQDGHGFIQHDDLPKASADSKKKKKVNVEHLPLKKSNKKPALKTDKKEEREAIVKKADIKK